MKDTPEMIEKRDAELREEVADSGWNEVERKLNELYIAYNKPNNNDASAAALHKLMKAYDEWID